MLASITLTTAHPDTKVHNRSVGWLAKKPHHISEAPSQHPNNHTDNINEQTQALRTTQNRAGQEQVTLTPITDTRPSGQLTFAVLIPGSVRPAGCRSGNAAKDDVDVVQNAETVEKLGTQAGQVGSAVDDDGSLRRLMLHHHGDPHLGHRHPTTGASAVAQADT